MTDITRPTFAILIMIRESSLILSQGKRPSNILILCCFGGGGGFFEKNIIINIFLLYCRYYCFVPFFGKTKEAMRIKACFFKGFASRRFNAPFALIDFSCRKRPGIAIASLTIPVGTKTKTKTCSSDRRFRSEYFGL